MIYRNPYQKICGIMGVSYKGHLYKEPYRLSKEINTF
jgi:hypothetical protein